MPLDPRTWSAGDTVTASRLNNDLYAYQGKSFSPNGIRFHARRPFYKATVQPPTAGTSGTNVGAGNTTPPIPYGPLYTAVLADTSADYGAQMDGAFTGELQDATAYSDGGTPGLIGGGGWYLISSFTPFTNVPAGAQVYTIIANGFNGSNPIQNMTSTLQAGLANHDVTPYAVDLLQTGSNPFFVSAVNNATTSVNLNFSEDGSGESFYLQALWASVDAARYGETVTTLPAPKSSWANTDTVTASLLNGNTGIRDVLRFLNSPPAIKVRSNAGTSVPASTQTTISLGATPNLLQYPTSWSGSTSTWTAPFNGVYLLYGFVAFPTGSTSARCGLEVAGSPYWGPSAIAPTVHDCGVAKVGLFDLNAGDTVQLLGYQVGGGTATTSTNNPAQFIALWMGAKGTLSTLATPPDLSYRYPPQGGLTAAQGALNSHLANDLSFLVNKPYLLSYQSTAQSVTDGTDTLITMNSVKGQVHNSTGDNYSGWNSTNKYYVAQVPGWYMAVEEIFFPNATLSGGATIAEMQVSNNVNALNATDWYQHLGAMTTGPPTGAAGIGFYYLRAGDTIAPWGRSQGLVSGTNSTVVQTGVNSHFELIWVSE